MKLKSIVLIFTALVIGFSFVAYSINAQKKKVNEEIKTEVQSDENLMAELRKNVICTMLYESIMAKETDQWTIKKADCADRYSNSFLEIQKGKEKLSVNVFDLKTPEQAKEILATFRSQGHVVHNKDYGDEGLIEYRSPESVANLIFIKGRFYVIVYCYPCNSDKTSKRFAEYALKVIEGQ